MHLLQIWFLVILINVNSLFFFRFYTTILVHAFEALIAIRVAR